MRWTPRALLPVLVGFFVVLSAGVALALPATQADNTAMVDNPNAGPGGNAVAVRAIVQAGNVVWVGGIFSEIDDANGNTIQQASALAPFDATTGALASGVHVPIVTDASGNPEVYDESLGPDGNLYIAGNFDHVDGSLRNGVAAINPATGALVAGFHPAAGAANSVLATASAIYVGTNKILSYQLNGAATPGWLPPQVFIDANIRQHETLPQIRDLAISGNTIVAACQCDSMTDATGTDFVKAVVEVNATTGRSIVQGGNFWSPAGLPVSGNGVSGAFGITLLVHNYPGNNVPTIYLAAGGSDFTAAYRVDTGAQWFKEDTSGSSQGITWYQGYLVVGGHYDWTQKSGSSTTCADNDHPAITGGGTGYACWFTPKLTAFSATNGDPMLDGTGKPWSPGICCKYNGVWVVYTAPDGSTLYVGGEFTKFGGTWHDNDTSPHLTGLNWSYTGGQKQQYVARLGGPALSTQTLTLTKNLVANAQGTVTSSPGGISCNASCTTAASDFTTGVNVTLTATPTNGNTFLGWSSGDAGFNCPGTGPCTVNMNIARAVTATFAGQTYSLTVTKTGTGASAGLVTGDLGTINCGSTCSATYPQGTVVTLTATPPANTTFDGWSGSGCSGTGQCVVTVDGVKNVSAAFTSQTKTLGLAKVGTKASAGNVTSSPTGISCLINCTSVPPVGFTSPTVTLTATAPGGTKFGGWSSSDPAFSCPGLTPCTVTMDQNRNVTADFDQARKFSVTFGGAGGGTVSTTPDVGICTATCTNSELTFADGTQATLTATPNSNSVFTGWSATPPASGIPPDAGCTGTGTCTTTMNGGKSTTATFQPGFPLTVTPAGDGDGTVTSDVNHPGINCGLTCSKNFLQSTTVTLSATAGENSVFAGWSGEGCTGTGTCQVLMSQARNVTANFNLVQRTLNVTVVGQGTVNDSPGPINCTGPVPDTGTCTAQYEHGTDVSLIATPAPHWAFTGWTGACDGALDCFVSMVQDQSVTATFAPIKHTLTVNLAGFGVGTVTSTPSGIDCGNGNNDCIDDFNEGSPVSLSAVAQPGSVFTGWSGDCSGTGTCDFGSFDGPQTVTATFQPVQHLTAAIGGTGNGTVTSDVGGIDCPNTTCVSSDLANGTHVLLTGNPEAGYAVAGWDYAGCETSPTCDVTVNGDFTVTADFEPAYDMNVTLDSVAGGTGAVTSTYDEIDCPDTTCSASFVQNASVTLTATPASDAAFTGWSGNVGSCTTDPQCVVTMDAVKNVTAQFTHTWVLTVQRAGSGGAGSVTSSPGSITCDGVCEDVFVDGTPVDLNAVDGNNTAFDNWTGDTSCTNDNPCTVVMDQDRTITAHFDPIWQSLTVTGSGTGSGTVTSDPAGIDCGVTCAAPSTFQQGSDVTLHAEADGTSTFIGWSSIDPGFSCSGTTDCTVTMDQARTVDARFDLAQRLLTVSTNGNGAGSITSDFGGIDCPSTPCSVGYTHGTVVQLTATVGANSTFNGWGGDTACATTNPCSVTMDQARSISATFILVKHTLTVSKNGNGTGSVSADTGAVNCGATCSGQYDHGTTVQLSANPDANMVFAGWSGGGCSGIGTCIVTMNADTDVTATFNKVKHTLTVSIGGGTGTIASNVGTINCPGTCSNQYDHGTVVQLTATPVAPSTTFTWSGGGCSGNTNPCTVTLNADTTVTATFSGGTTTIGNDSDLIQYNGWVGVNDNGANGGMYRRSNVKSDKITFKTTAGTSVQWLTRTGPDGGNAKVTIDGTVKDAAFSEYSAAPAFITRTYGGLLNKVHTVVITVLHTKVAASSNFYVSLDAFQVGATVTQEWNSKLQLDTWKSTTQALASDGTYRSSKTATATVTVNFTGTSIDLITTKGKAYGKIKVTVDGGSPSTIDLYKATTTWQSVVNIPALSAGNHTMVIQVLNQKNASATATTVVIDGFVVHP